MLPLVVLAGAGQWPQPHGITVRWWRCLMARGSGPNPTASPLAGYVPTAVGGKGEEFVDSSAQCAVQEAPRAEGVRGAGGAAR